MLEITEIPVPLNQGATKEGCLEAGRREAERLLGCQPFDIADIRLHRKTVDARKKQHIQFSINIRVELRDGLDERSIMTGLSKQNAQRVRIVEDRSSSFPPSVGVGERQVLRPVVVGAGSAGLFAALALAEAGLEPLLVERGGDPEERISSVRHLEETGELDLDTNTRFGAGGSGACSGSTFAPGGDNPDHQLVLNTLVQAGAPRRILWEAEPRIGSDLLPGVVANLVSRIRALDGEVRFNTKLIGIDRARDGSMRNITVLSGGREESILANRLVLACGVSARDIYAILRDTGVQLARRTFYIGVRIEHLQEDIDRARFGSSAGNPALGAASYKLNARCGNGHGISTADMCPGGEVVPAQIETGCMAVCGASTESHDGRNANAALLASIGPGDLEGDDPLAGMDLQRSCERAAHELGGEQNRAPAQLLGDFLSGVPSTGAGRIEPTYPLGVTWTALDEALPASVVETLRLGVPTLNRKLRGFNDPEAVLVGVEAPSGAPVTIVRNKDYQAAGTPGLYPCGEGSGYVGSTVAAAADGINCARALIESLPTYLKRSDAGTLS